MHELALLRRQTYEEIAMTMTVSAQPQSESALSWARVPRDQEGRSRREQSSVRRDPEINVTAIAGLLEDPAIALWAREAAFKYQVSALGALGLLAHASPD